MIYHTRPPAGFFGKLKAAVKAAFSRENVPDFKTRLRSIKTDGEGAGGPADQRWQRYGAYSIASYILDEDNNELVDEVVKLEEINQQLPAILKRIGIPHAEKLNIPFTNKRKSKKLDEYYDEESIALIARYYHYDIERFNYCYEE